MEKRKPNWKRVPVYTNEYSWLFKSQLNPEGTETKNQRRPVITPEGEFRSVSAASRHYGKAIAWLQTRLNSPSKYPGFRYK